MDCTTIVVPHTTHSPRNGERDSERYEDISSSASWNTGWDKGLRNGGGSKLSLRGTQYMVVLVEAIVVGARMALRGRS